MLSKSRDVITFCIVAAALVIAARALSQVTDGQGTWTVRAPVPVGRTEFPAAVVSGRVYLLGGSARGVAYDMNRNDEYDPATGSWRAAAPLSRARDHLVAVAVDGRIHVIGGRFSVGDEDMTDLHEIYDPATDSWSIAPPMPTPRGGISGAFHQGMIFILGAEDGLRTYDENEAYDVNAKRWFNLKPVPQKLHGSAVASAGRY